MPSQETSNVLMSLKVLKIWRGNAIVGVTEVPVCTYGKIDILNRH